MSNQPIGIFDSGIGGLSILTQIRELLPNESLIYFADQAHVPYGPRPLAEVRHFSMEITSYLLQRGAKCIVVACNTASAAALDHLRASFQHVPFVGMEPAVKPAAEVTDSGHIGVLATPATFEGELFASVVARFASGVKVHQRTAPGLVERIEQGDLRGPETRMLVWNAVQPLLDQGIDTLVLGCTHYPYIVPLLEEFVGPEVRVIDPAPAIARQTRRVLESNKLTAAAGSTASIHYVTSGDPARMAELIHLLVGEPGELESIRWLEGQLPHEKSN
ncbi:MAG: glutamate racemase [Anaerolineales bacterium]